MKNVKTLDDCCNVYTLATTGETQYDWTTINYRTAENFLKKVNELLSTGQTIYLNVCAPCTKYMLFYFSENKLNFFKLNFQILHKQKLFSDFIKLRNDFDKDEKKYFNNKNVKHF